MLIYNKGLRTITTTNGEKDKDGKELLVHLHPSGKEEIKDDTAQRLLKMYPHDLIQFADVQQTADLNARVTELTAELRASNELIESLKAEIKALKDKDEKVEDEKETENENSEKNKETENKGNSNKNKK